MLLVFIHGTMQVSTSLYPWPGDVIARGIYLDHRNKFSPITGEFIPNLVKKNIESFLPESSFQRLIPIF